VSFLRHGKSIDPISEWGNAGSRSSSLPRRSSASMSFSWLFLGGVVSTRARFRFTNRGQCAINSLRWSRVFQRTAKYLLTGCLTPGGKLISALSCFTPSRRRAGATYAQRLPDRAALASPRQCDLYAIGVFVNDIRVLTTLPGSDSNARTRIQSPRTATRRPRITRSAVSLSCTVTHSTADSSMLWPSLLRSVRARSTSSR
jgi:hypothetical protein